MTKHWTAYTIRITGSRAREYPELGRWKDRNADGLAFIRFPGGDGAWFAPGEWADTEGTEERLADVGQTDHALQLRLLDAALRPVSSLFSSESLIMFIA